MSNNLVKKMEAIEWLKGIEPESVQLFVLDPPYNVSYSYNTFKDNKPQEQYIKEQIEIIDQCALKLKPGGSIFYLNYPENAADVWSRVSSLNRFEWITWVYNVHSAGTPLRKGSRAWLWFTKNDPLINQEAFASEYKNPTDKRVKERIALGFKPSGYDWWEQQQVKNVSKEKREHPCQVPEKMVEKIILGTSNEGDLVCDVYSGSGTTGICAVRLGRNFNGCDIDEKYVNDSNAALDKILEEKSIKTI